MAQLPVRNGRDHSLHVSFRVVWRASAVHTGLDRESRSPIAGMGRDREGGVQVVLIFDVRYGDGDH